MSYNLKIKYKFEHNSDIANYEDSNVDELRGVIYLEENDSKPVKIGHINLDLYNGDSAWVDDLDMDLWEAFFRKTESFRIGSTLYDLHSSFIRDEIIEKIGDSFNQSILIVDEIILHEKYRGKGYGRKILCDLELYFAGRCGYIALQSFPKQCEPTIDDIMKSDRYNLKVMEQSLEMAQLSLNKFYEDCGYTNVEENHNIFIKNIAPCD